ncbi:MAG: regulatory protein RecX [Candidatus Berkelbacteria bacterium]
MKKTPQEYVINLLKIRERSEGEIRQKMKLKGYFLEEVESVVSFMKERNFLDDSRFTKLYVRSKRLTGQYGKHSIRCRLKSFQIAEEIVENELAEITQEEELAIAKNLAEKWLAKKQEKDRTYEKLGRFLMGRGFGYDLIKKVLAELIQK